VGFMVVCNDTSLDCLIDLQPDIFQLNYTGFGNYLGHEAPWTCRETAHTNWTQREISHTPWYEGETTTVLRAVHVKEIYLSMHGTSSAKLS
jgi:hypothetical protein